LAIKPNRFLARAERLVNCNCRLSPCVRFGARSSFH